MPLMVHHTASKHFQEKQHDPNKFILHLEHGTSSQVYLKDSEGNKDVSWSPDQKLEADLPGSFVVCLVMFPSLSESMRMLSAARPAVA